MFADNLHSADDTGPFAVRMVEERHVTFQHRAHVTSGLNNCQLGYEADVSSLGGLLPAALRTPASLAQSSGSISIKTVYSLPSQASGSVAFMRSSMENLTSFPFSKRELGSAFISQ